LVSFFEHISFGFLFVFLLEFLSEHISFGFLFGSVFFLVSPGLHMTSAVILEPQINHP